ncbi:MAG: C40 family peptidase [FCB group bacterium]|nr:C40 family peptidase [FCB group bacterium]
MPKINLTCVPKLFLIGSLLFVIQCGNTDLQESRTLIREVQMKFAPDKRVSIFDIQADRESGTLILQGETNIPEVIPALAKKIEAAQLNARLDITILPVEELADSQYGIVNLSVTNLRAKPDRGSELVTQAIMGTPVRRYKSDDYWDLIQTPDGYLGWVDRGTVVWMDQGGFDTWRSAKRCIFTAPFGLVFSPNNGERQTISDLVVGSILETEGISGNNWIVRLPDGRQGMIPRDQAVDFTKWVQTQQAKPAMVITRAKTFLGFPYLWGGTSSKGFDCSGFTKTVYFMNGIVLPRDASQQVKTGQLVTREVNTNLMKPGDLVFFGRRATADRPEKATHVGIYLGDTEFIHSSGKVKINSFDSTRTNYNDYRYTHFLQARRVLTDTTIPQIRKMNWYQLDTEKRPS